MSGADKRLKLCGALLICNLVFIWGNSLLPGQISLAFSDWVQSLLETPVSSAVAGTGSGVLRKIAHFTEFACLGALLAWWMGMKNKKTVVALALAVAAACVDETIQLFIPGRAPGIWDVALDSCGALAGMLLLRYGHNNWKTKHILEEN